MKVELLKKMWIDGKLKKIGDTVDLEKGLAKNMIAAQRAKLPVGATTEDPEDDDALTGDGEGADDADGKEGESPPKARQPATGKKPVARKKQTAVK